MPSQEIFARRAVVDRELKKLKDRIVELEKSSKTLTRKSRGITKANKDLVMLSRKVEDLEARFIAGGPTPAVMQELERLSTATGGLYLQVAEQGDTLRDHGDRITTLEQSEAQSISFAESGIDVAHEGEIETSTPWGEAFLWALAGAVLGFFLFVLFLNVRNGWVGVIAFFGIAFFGSAFLLQKHQLKLAIQARHNWAYKQQAVAVSQESIAEPATEQWWNPAGTPSSGGNS